MGETIAFVGLGVMGCPMAGHLLAAGHHVTVYTRTEARARDLIRRGAKWAPTAADAARGADVAFVCVRDTPDVRSVCLGEDGLVHGLAAGAIIVDHSTIAPDATRDIAAQLAERGIAFLDAPVSGGDVGARAATLSIMVGGADDCFRRVEPLLRHMGKTIVHAGPVGSGQLAKLANQVLVTVTNMAVCEALTFAVKNGLDAKALLEAWSAGAAGSWQLVNLGPRMLGRDFRPGFTIDLQQKDLRLVLEAAESARVSLPATSLVHQLFTAAQAAGSGAEGTQALFKVIEGLSELH